MDLAPLKLYRALLKFRGGGDATRLFERICNELIDERIKILKSFNLLSCFGGETKIRRGMIIKTLTAGDVERENALNEEISFVLTEYKKRFTSQSYDLRPLIGFFNGKTISESVFSSLKKELAVLARTKCYVSDKLKNDPCSLLCSSFKKLNSYRDIKVLVDLVDNQQLSGEAYRVVVEKSVSPEPFIKAHLLSKCDYLTQEQADKILSEANNAYNLKKKAIRDYSTRSGLFGFLGMGVIYVLAFFFLSLLATYCGYSWFGATVGGKVSDFTDYQKAFIGMIFILPTFFLATYFGSYVRRWVFENEENPLFFQLAPRFFPPGVLIAHAVILFALTKNPPGDASSNIWYKVFYLGDKGYTLALISIFIAVTTLVMDIFSWFRNDSINYWETKGKHGRGFLTQNGSFYVIPYFFVLRLFMPTLHLSIMIALAILTFAFGFVIPMLVFSARFIRGRNRKSYGFSKPVIIKGLLTAAIFTLITLIIYLTLTYIHAKAEWFAKLAFLSNLGWFVLLFLASSAILMFISELNNIEIKQNEKNFLDISPTFCFTIVGFILTFFVCPKGSEASPNIYYLGKGNIPIMTLIILLMFANIIHDVINYKAGGSKLFNCLFSSRVSNLGYFIVVVINFIMARVMMWGFLMVIATFMPIALSLLYILCYRDSGKIALFSYGRGIL